MKKGFILKLTWLFILGALVIAPVFSLALPVQAQDGVDLWGEPGASGVGDALGYRTGSEPEDPRLVAARIIKIALTFIGIIAVAIIIWAGFKWMTAGGNEEKVTEARKLITSAIIGLLIILAAWTITSWVIDKLTTEVLVGG